MWAGSVLFSHHHKTIGIRWAIQKNYYHWCCSEKHVSEACHTSPLSFKCFRIVLKVMLCSLYGGISKEFILSRRKPHATECSGEGDGCPWMGDRPGHHTQYSWHNILGEQTAEAQAHGIRQWFVSTCFDTRSNPRPASEGAFIHFHVFKWILSHLCFFYKKDLNVFWCGACY